MVETVKHTPGPWRVRADLDGKPKLDSRDGYTVERADPTAGKPFVVSTWSLPNARLIAAAPEMLAALKLVAESGLFSCYDDRAWDTVNEAIAKATGND